MILATTDAGHGGRGWVERESECGTRWQRNMWPHRPDGPHVWLCAGNDGGGRPDLAAFWGGSSLDEIDWNFGGWCVHPVPRALELADVVAGVIESRPSVSGLVDWAEHRRPRGRTAMLGRHGEFNLVADAWRQGVRGRWSCGVGDDAVAGDLYDEVVDLWRWWIDFERPGGGKPWVLKSWAAWRGSEVAMAHAEQVARALAGAGFGLREVLGQIKSV